MPQDDESTARHADATAHPAPDPVTEPDPRDVRDRLAKVSKNARAT